jgi:hypothetical protein
MILSPALLISLKHHVDLLSVPFSFEKKASTNTNMRTILIIKASTFWGEHMVS